MAVVAWLGVIWEFGESQALPMASGDVLRWLTRKGLHVLVYAVLGGLLALALGPRPRWAWVIALCLLVALGDELHQAFVPRRSFRVEDFGIDLLGGLLGASVMGTIVGRTALRRREEA